MVAFSTLGDVALGIASPASAAATAWMTAARAPSDGSAGPFAPAKLNSDSPMIVTTTIMPTATGHSTMPVTFLRVSHRARWKGSSMARYEIVAITVARPRSPRRWGRLSGNVK